MKQKVFKFSIVMAVYNTEPFLRETIASVLSQDIGFEENVQLILVDDGSTDGSGELCDRFASLYPENIVCIHKENGGVSSARNEGIGKSNGKYINFFDSDDKLALDALRKVYDFFENHQNEIDVVSIPQIVYDVKFIQHQLNDKFKNGTRIIDLRKEQNIIQMSASSAFFKKEIFDNSGITFDDKVAFAEDAKLVWTALSKRGKLGVVADTKYIYQRRHTASLSAVQTCRINREWYSPVLEKVYLFHIRRCLDMYHYIPKFIQSGILYDLKWKMNTSLNFTEHVLSKEEIEGYLKLFERIVKYLDDDIIIKHSPHGVYWAEHWAFLLSKKYNEPAQLVPTGRDIDVRVHGIKVLSISNCKSFYNFLKIEEDGILLEGYASFLGVSETTEIRIFLRVNQTFDVECSVERSDYFGKVCMGEDIFPAYTFRGKIPFKPGLRRVSITLWTSVDGIMVERKDLRVGKHFPVTKRFKQAYCEDKGWMGRWRDNQFVLEMSNCASIEEQESRFLEEIGEEKDENAQTAIVYRKIYRKIQPRLRKEIWLLSDRINKSYDNGEALFHYIRETKKPVDAYFILRKDSADFGGMSEMGPVLDYLSPQHLLMQLLASKFISSSFDDYVVNPFFSSGDYYRDILWKKKIIYLQHGVLHNAQFSGLHRQRTGFDRIITSAPRETEFLLDKRFGYDKEVPSLCGAPRFDRMEDDRRQIVTIMPTWRSSLADGSSFDVNGIHKYHKNFIKSEYFQFYNTLINHSRLLDHAEKLGYTIQFMPHPNVINYIDLFNHNPSVTFCHIDTKYYDIFSQSSLVVTDYSSAIFDFAYLYKPVLYCQFDKEDVSIHHIYDPGKGYFDYEKDGFGEVEYSLNRIVDRIIEYMESGCELKEIYRKRIDEFFAFHDRRNCERTYETICSLNSSGQGTYSSKCTNPPLINNLLDVVLKGREEEFGEMPESTSKVKPKVTKRTYMKYVFPNHLFHRREKVVLYGAGEVGQDFYRTNQREHFVDIVAIVDRNADQLNCRDLPVQLPEIISEIEYDSILLGIRFENVANSVRQYLKQIGIPDEKIKWDGKMYHLDDFYQGMLEECAIRNRLNYLHA